MAPHQGQVSSGPRIERKEPRRSWRGHPHPARAVIAVGLAAFAALIADRAAASTLRLVYEAPAECPGSEAFIAAVRAQTKTATLTADGDGSPGISVRIARSGSQLRGRLEIEEPGREASVREVTATTCEEVVSALALMTALAIDADLEARPTNPPTAAPTSPEPQQLPQIPSPAAPQTSTPPEPAPPNKPQKSKTAPPRPRAPPIPRHIWRPQECRAVDARSRRVGGSRRHGPVWHGWGFARCG